MISLDRLLDLQQKYEFYLEASRETIYTKGFGVTETDLIIEQENEDVLALINATIAEYHGNDNFEGAIVEESRLDG
jgi:hypothetical protein